MTSLISTEQLKKKAIERWENEGGKFFEEQTAERFSPVRRIMKQDEAMILRRIPVKTLTERVSSKS